LRVRETHFAVVENFANGWPFIRGDFHQIEAGLLSLLKSLSGWDQAQLLSLDADQANGTNADLLVDPWATVGRRLTIGKSNIWSP
jgi:hypothetical protein